MCQRRGYSRSAPLFFWITSPLAPRLLRPWLRLLRHFRRVPAAAAHLAAKRRKCLAFIRRPLRPRRFCVAVVDEDELIDGRLIQPGDRVVGIASSGVHSNGFSLVRKVLERAGADDQTRFGVEQRGLIDALLTPTTLYPKLVRELLDAGLKIPAWHTSRWRPPENLPRCLPKGTTIDLDVSAWPRPEIFRGFSQRTSQRRIWNTSTWESDFVSCSPRAWNQRLCSSANRRPQSLADWRGLRSRGWFCPCSVRTTDGSASVSKVMQTEPSRSLSIE